VTFCFIDSDKIRKKSEKFLEEEEFYYGVHGARHGLPQILRNLIFLSWYLVSIFLIIFQINY